MMRVTMLSSTSQWHSQPQCYHGAHLNMGRKWVPNYKRRGQQSVGPQIISSNVQEPSPESFTLVWVTPTWITNAGRGLRTWTLSEPCTRSPQATLARMSLRRPLQHWQLLPWCSEKWIPNIQSCCFKQRGKLWHSLSNIVVLTVTH